MTYRLAPSASQNRVKPKFRSVAPWEVTRRRQRRPSGSCSQVPEFVVVNTTCWGTANRSGNGFPAFVSVASPARTSMDDKAICWMRARGNTVRWELSGSAPTWAATGSAPPRSMATNHRSRSPPLRITPAEECVLIERYRAICGTGRLTDFWRSLIGTNCVLVRPLDWRCAGGGELDFAFSHCVPNVPDGVGGVNPACRFQVLAFCFVASRATCAGFAAGATGV